MRHPRLVTVVLVAVAVALAVGPVEAKDRAAKQAEEEIEFGYKAAKRGYWQEALARFKLADDLTPNQPRILNNIAVSLEANGRFDEARIVYEAGLALDPRNSALQKNFSRFNEFYATFVAAEENGDEGASPEETRDEEGSDDEG